MRYEEGKWKHFNYYGRDKRIMRQDKGGKKTMKKECQRIHPNL